MSDIQIYCITGAVLCFAILIGFAWLAMRDSRRLDEALDEHVKDWEQQQKRIRTLESRAHKLQLELALFKNKLKEILYEESD